jgi:DNA-directed RNA polymerase specialized sigma24 family protein
MEEISAELVAAARKGKREAVVELLAIHYPIVWRIAAGISGRDDVARGVVRFVMQRSLRALHTWNDEAAPTRWFHHHTILTCRRSAKHQPDASNDVFLQGDAAATNMPYVAFVRALRALPMQQREALILSRCEKLDMRAVSVAMDCSTTAAANHLREASQRLVSIAQQDFDVHVLRMTKVYATLGPDEELHIKDLRSRIRGLIRPWRIMRMAKFGLNVVILIVTIYAAWWVWRIVAHSLVQVDP